MSFQSSASGGCGFIRVIDGHIFRKLDVQRNEVTLILRHVFLRINGVNRTLGNAYRAVDALIRVDRQHVRPLAKAIHRTNVDAVRVFALDACFDDDVRHPSSPLQRCIAQTAILVACSNRFEMPLHDENVAMTTRRQVVVSFCRCGRHRGAAVRRAIAVVRAIRIGEINSYSTIPQFTLPYRMGWQLAVDEANAAGGLLGRRVEVISRDDAGKPEDAIRLATELKTNENVALITGTFLSNVGLAVADFALAQSRCLCRRRAAD